MAEHPMLEKLKWQRLIDDDIYFNEFPKWYGATVDQVRSNVDAAMDQAVSLAKAAVPDDLAIQIPSGVDLNGPTFTSLDLGQIAEFMIDAQASSVRTLIDTALQWMKRTAVAPTVSVTYRAVQGPPVTSEDRVEIVGLPIFDPPWMPELDHDIALSLKPLGVGESTTLEFIWKHRWQLLDVTEIANEVETRFLDTQDGSVIPTASNGRPSNEPDGDLLIQKRVVTEWRYLLRYNGDI